MRQLLKHETVCRLFSLLLMIYLIGLPMAMDFAAAAELQTGDVTIAHFPSRVGRYGQQLTIRAHIPNDSDINKVTLVVQNEDGDSPLRGAMPRLTQAGLVPVTVTSKGQAAVRTGAAAHKSIKGRMQIGELMYVAGEKDGYFRGISESGLKGYVLKSDVTLDENGHAYAVTLPSSITSRSKLTYFIEATDASGVTTQTEPVTMRLLTNEEIDMFLAMYGGNAPATGTPLIKKPLFWASVVALAGGAYILTTDNDGGTETTPVNVLVEWE